MAIQPQRIPLATFQSSGGEVPVYITREWLKFFEAIGITNIAGLQALLDAKANSTHSHTSSEITDFEAAVLALIASIDTGLTHQQVMARGLGG